MIISIYLRFSSIPGQELFICGNIPNLGNGDLQHARSMTYLSKNIWCILIDLTSKKFKNFQHLKYSFILKQQDNILKYDNGKHRCVAINKANQDITIIDSWNDMGRIENVYQTVPFEKVFFINNIKHASLDSKKKYHFTVEAPLLEEGRQLIITGNNHNMGNWLSSGYIPMEFDGKKWNAEVDFLSIDTPIEYKYCVFNKEDKKIIYEEGENRFIPFVEKSSTKTFIYDAYLRIANHRWRGTGIAIPVFSLRTKKSMGVGEFCDIKKLVDWSSTVSIKMIQLLPVNDTTLTHTRRDSYPYASISAFALHPIYISLEKIAGNKYKNIIEPFLLKRKKLNAKINLDYDTVMNIKWKALKALHKSMFTEVSQKKEYIDFVKTNYNWLFPYASFSYFRDQFKTVDTSSWNQFEHFNEKITSELFNVTLSEQNKLSLYYFIQYHLHKQLKDAHSYANKHGIILKGDIPIGVNRHGVETWTDPELFNLHMQAGAPPDDFATKGQNWGFPTYNWSIMKINGFLWWKKRFHHMANYFDAFRIDHILGFFRIWSIPTDQVEGIMGKFVPAIPILRSELLDLHIDFTPDRYCMPYITDIILMDMAGLLFHEIKGFLIEMPDGTYQIKPEYATQKLVDSYFKQIDSSNKQSELKEVLYNLISNVILLNDDKNVDKYHFRFNMPKTESFKYLDKSTKQKLVLLYNDYFYYRQDNLWKEEALEKLPLLKLSTDMLICGEDLGFIPRSVPEVMTSLGILSMEVQRMPKISNTGFFNPLHASYLSVVTPSTHDMSTIREWWQESKELVQKFYTHELGQVGNAPDDANTSIVQSIILQHLASPAMLAVFQIQDLFAITDDLRTTDPKEERINIPENSNHYWKFRMKITLEELIKNNTFNNKLKFLIQSNGRG